MKNLNSQLIRSIYFRSLSNRQEFHVFNFNRNSLKNQCLLKLNISLETSIQEVIRLIAQHIQHSEQQIIIRKFSKYDLYKLNFACESCQSRLL